MGGLQQWGAGSIGARAVCLAVFAGTAVSACGGSDSPAAPEVASEVGIAAAQASAAAPDLSSLVGTLVGESELTAGQLQAISALGVPGAMPIAPREIWRLASELAVILTDEQIRSIEASITTARKSFRSKVRARRDAGQEGAQRRAPREARRAQEHAAMAEGLGLTEEQSEALQALAAERPDREAGPEWWESRRQAVASVLTAEQLQVVTLHRLLLGHRMRSAIGARFRHRPDARVHGGWGS